MLVLSTRLEFGRFMGRTSCSAYTIPNREQVLNLLVGLDRGFLNE